MVVTRHTYTFISIENEKKVKVACVQLVDRIRCLRPLIIQNNNENI